MNNNLIYKLRRNRFIRLCYFPFSFFVNLIRQIKYTRSSDSTFVYGLKNKYEGKRCFIIGNGPSLTLDDLSKLKNEYTFATNKFYQYYKLINWKPTFYLSIDRDVIRNNISDLISIDNGSNFINIAEKRRFPKNHKSHFIFLKGKFRINRHGTYQSKVSNELNKYFSFSENVVCNCIEFAFYLGFKEIYLIGVDNNYSGNNNYAKEIHNEIKPDFNYEATLYTYKTLFDYAKKNNILLLNATRGGKLDCIPRRTLESVFNE